MEELAAASADMYPPRTSQVWRTLLNWISLLFQIFFQIIRGAPSVLSYVGLRHPSLLSSASLQFKQLPVVELQEPEEASTFSSSIRISSDPVSYDQKLDKLTVVLDLDETLVCAYETSTVPATLRKQAIEAGLNCFELECISSEKESEGETKFNYVTVFERPGLHVFLKQPSEFADLVLFTAGLEGYARPLVDRIDVENRFKLRLYRPSTTSTSKWKLFVTFGAFPHLLVSPTSSIQWISPLHLKNTVHKPDLPAKTTGTITEVNRKLKFMSHEYAVNLIKREENPGHALEIFHKAANQKGFNHNNDTYATILHKLAKCKKFDLIDRILHQMAYETCKFHEGIFINLMKHFSTSCMHERVIEMFHAVQPIVRQKPSVKAFSTCLNLLIEANQIELAKRFLINTQKMFHLMPNTCIFNILVKYHCRQDDLDSAIKVMKEMKSSTISYPNLITYSTLMDGLCRRGRLEEAMILFEEMVSKDQIVPDALTYNILISGICREGKVDRAKSIIEFMRRNGCNPNVVNYTTLMNGFCKEGRLEDAKEVFKEMKTVGLQPDTVGYTTLIDSLCRANRLDEAIELLREMNRTESSADVVTYNVILGALCRACRFDDALDMLDKLPYDGVFLNKASYRIVLNSLCKEDELDKAANLLSLMLVRGFIPHFGTSNELLVSLCVAGNGSDAGGII